jgi:hypothetical protein
VIGRFPLEDPFLRGSRFPKTLPERDRVRRDSSGLCSRLPGITELRVESEAFRRDAGSFLEDIPSKLRHLERQSRVAKLIEARRKIN